MRGLSCGTRGVGGGWGGAVAFASYCVPVQLRPGAGGRGQPGGSESQVTLAF